MLNSRQRAYLKSLAASRNVIVYIGKNGITDSLVEDAGRALAAKELVKCAVQEMAPLTSSEACARLAELCGAEPVQSIGRKFVIYRENRDIPAEKRIKLPE